MLPDRYRQLLTAYVDGELTARQRRHVSRLLHRSPEARELLRKLQGDARELRTLPCPPLPVDLTGDVLRVIAERRLSPGRLRPRRVPAASAWAAPLATWAAAAAVLLILGLASYVYFAASVTPPSNPPLARNQDNPSPPVVLPEDSRPAPVARVETPSVPRDPQPSGKPDAGVKTPPVAVVKRPEEKPRDPGPDVRPAPPKEEAPLTDRLEMFRLKEVDALLPVVLKVQDLEQEATRTNFLSELRKDANFRIELPCKSGTKAFERVRAAAKALNLGLLIEKRAQDRLQLPSVKTNYVLYVENLPPEDLTRFLQLVAAEDKNSAARKPADAQLDRLVMTRMTADHHKELSTLIGVDPTVLEPAARGPLGTDPRKPLSEETARQVSESLAGQGSTSRPAAGKSAGKPPEHLALVLAYNPVRPSPGSAEIKRFLDQRKPTKPGTLHVLLVLRS